ncbi:MAG: pilus assembly protein [Microbacteriaceae bacterium]|nr:pilus assembly protein [Microbacteriaceae bacterium]
MRARVRRPRLRRLAAERGSVAVEFAVALPAVVLVLGLAIGAVVAAGVQVRVDDAAGEAARLSARGDDPGAALGGVGGGAAVEVWDAGELRCARVTAPVRLLGVAVGATAAGTSCALRDVDG